MTPAPLASQAFMPDPSFNPVQETRFELVMYGDGSLAIYINGITMELLNLVRATPTSDTGRHGSTAAICRELAQKLNSPFVMDISQRFFHHVLCLVYPFEILLILCGRWFNVDDMRRFGWKAFWLTLGINFSAQALGDWMRRKGRQGQAIATYCWEVCADRLTRSRTGKVGVWVRRITGGRP